MLLIKKTLKFENSYRKGSWKIMTNSLLTQFKILLSNINYWTAEFAREYNFLCFAIINVDANTWLLPIIDSCESLNVRIYPMFHSFFQRFLWFISIERKTGLFFFILFYNTGTYYQRYYIGLVLAILSNIYDKDIFGKIVN